MTTIIDGQLEIDHDRGVIYFHVGHDEHLINKVRTVSILRICRLPSPIPIDMALDITFGYGVSWVKSF